MEAGCRVAVPTPTSTDPEYNRRSSPMYAAAIRQSGGSPVEVDLGLTENEIVALVRTCQGILLPGSPADVNPAWYGQEPIAACAFADPRREAADHILLEEAYAVGKPVLGICYGVQSLNVWRGGTLRQDLPFLPVNHAAGAQVAVAHTAVVREGGILASLVASEEAATTGQEFRLPINSSHHQSVDQLGAGLRVAATSPDDDVVEAIEGAENYESPAFVLGVQWHPERSLEMSPTARAIFRAFVEQAAGWKAQHSRVLAS